ncbi:MAG: citrate synthase [Planctomycetota bacterium]|nr:MAG: citrate synthase [Planctomycetota bacterium]
MVPTLKLVPGLADVPVVQSSISYIDGNKGILEYRSYPIEVLAARSNFEETCWLLLYGTLPSRAELESFKKRLADQRELPARTIDMLRSLPGAGHPMHALQASISALGMFSRKRDIHNPDDVAEACLRIIAATPVLVAAFDRLRTGKDYVAPDPSLDTAANFLYMLSGAKPDDFAARVLDVALILHAEHTMNASTFAARVVASTEADPYTVCSSAVGALTGPLHGGANERVLEVLRDIGSPDKVEAWVEAQLKSKGKVMGFGHRVYKVKDPRALILQDLAKKLFERLGSTPIYDVAVELERQVEKRLGHRGIYPNVDFFSGIVYSKLGISTDLFTPVFAISRVAGYCAHWMEQMIGNKIFRPDQVYTGGHQREYVDISLR